MISLAIWARAVLLFYRSVAPFMLGITALIVGGVLMPALLEGSARGLLLTLVLGKLITMPVAWYLSEQMRPDQYWFFYNLGISRLRLWAGVVSLDGLLFLGLGAATEAAFSWV
jgi:hypothetical protein